MDPLLNDLSVVPPSLPDFVLQKDNLHFKTKTKFFVLLTETEKMSFDYVELLVKEVVPQRTRGVVLA